jgi:serralysin
MANYSAVGAVSADMRWNLAGLWTGTVNSEDSTKMEVDVGGGFLEDLFGTALSYDIHGHPLGGTITSLEEHEIFQGTNFTDVTVSGFAISAVQFFDWARTGDNASALQAIFGGDDTMIGSPGDDYMTGLSGHDVMSGGSGSDTLIGGDGNDHLYGQSASGGTDGADAISGGNGSDYIQGNAGNDTLDGGLGSDRINGGGDDDNITGGDGNDTVNGNRGNDMIAGDNGSDSLRGGQGDDTISGGSGDDQISGDKGIDVLTGGDGHDLFRFAAGDAAIVTGKTDTITDYTHGTDHIALGFAPTSLLTGGAQASLATAQTFAQSLFDGHADDHEVAAIQVGSDTYLLFAGNAGSTVDSAVLLQGVSASTINLTDFL